MIRKAFSLLASLILSLSAFSADLHAGPIVLENEAFRLVLSEDGCAESLILKATGEECICNVEKEPFFSVTQDRPFNNEVKLAHPNKRTTYYANKLSAQETPEGMRITVSFEMAPYEAIVDVKMAPEYISFSLSGFSVHADGYPGLKMAVPPVAEFRMIDLPVRNRVHFGEWLNAMWDDVSAVCVAGCDPWSLVWHEDRADGRVLTADLYSGKKLRGGSIFHAYSY